MCKFFFGSFYGLFRQPCRGMRSIPSRGLPEAIALAAVAGSYLWKRNSILSVVLGTVLYMFLVQSIF